MIRVDVEHRQGAFSLEAAFSSPARVLGVFGPSGGGKSTLLGVLAGVTRARRARVEVDGVTLEDSSKGLRLPAARRGLALVPQDALLFPHLDVRENLTYAPAARAEFSAPRGREILDVLGLEPLLDRDPRALSGGERQRVALGRALLSRPRMLLLDEPVSALDAERARQVMALLLEAKRRLDVAMILVTHRPAELIALADDCVLLTAGRVAAQGPPLEVLKRPTSAAVANLLGVDNLLRLVVHGHAPEDGVTWLDLGDEVRLAAPLVDAAPGSAVDVGLHAEDVILCRERPGGTSARNVLAARVASMDEVGRETLVALEVGRAHLRVRVTPGAVRDLALAPGGRVWALIKTTALHHLA